MSPERFEHLLQLTAQKISRRGTRFRKSMPAAERLAFTLRFLASVDSQKSLSFAFRIGTTTVSNIINETCIALKEVLTDRFINHRVAKQIGWRLREILNKFRICQTL